ncbi:hypothetical protein ACLQ3D_01165 [Micromonospora vinacea]|uniref:hypothetical protein n=1 Tax=Micromonospora vinacea TaxID=709878 RepID=UPI003CF398D3
MRFRTLARSALASALVAATGLVAAVAPARAADTSTVIGYEVLWDGNSAFRWNQGTATVEVARQSATVSLTGPTTANVAPAAEAALRNGRTPGPGSGDPGPGRIPLPGQSNVAANMPGW